MTEDVCVASVTQYLRPDGRRRDSGFELPSEIKPLYDEMKKAGCWVEVEVLTTGEVSMTVFDPAKEEAIDMSVTQNGPKVKDGLVFTIVWFSTAIENLLRVFKNKKEDRN